MCDRICKTLFINLESRPDRLKHVTQQLESIGISGERFNAIKLKNGRVGCSMSHLKCLELAKKNNWDNVFICEDDITFTNPELFKNQLLKFLDNVNGWDVIIVGGNNMPPHQILDDFCIKVSYCQTTTGYIVNKSYYDTLITNFKEGITNLLRNPDKHIIFAIDKFWISLQRTDNWFMITPPTVTQYENFSDIEDRITNYNWHMLDINKEEVIKKYMESLKEHQ